MTFFGYILPIILTILLISFYAKYIDKDKTITFIPRLFRWLSLLLVFIPVLGIVVFGIWIFVCFSHETSFKQNKITDFFINN